MVAERCARLSGRRIEHASDDLRDRELAVDGREPAAARPRMAAILDAIERDGSGATGPGECDDVRRLSGLSRVAGARRWSRREP